LKNRFKELRRRWQEVAKRVGDFEARLILSVFYLLFVLPIGLVVRLFSDPLGLKKTAARWIHRPSTPARIDDARRQF
jgi:hypothetical protein